MFLEVFGRLVDSKAWSGPNRKRVSCGAILEDVPPGTTVRVFTRVGHFANGDGKSSTICYVNQMILARSFDEEDHAAVRRLSARSHFYFGSQRSSNEDQDQVGDINSGFCTEKSSH